MEPASLWREYLPERYRDAGPRAESVSGRTVMVVEDEACVRDREFPWPESQVPQRSTRMLTRVRLARDGAAARLADMDAHGVDAQLIFPSVASHLLGREYRDPGLLAACCTAYNRWARDDARAAPDRLLWAAILPLQEPKRAADEAWRAAEDGAAGFFLRPNPICGRNLHHSDHDPLWNVIETIGKPVCIHDGSSPRLPSYGERMDTHTAGHILSHPFEGMAAMMSLIWYGVVERFPRLRVMQLETDSGWLPWWLERMDQHWDLAGTSEHPDLTMSPGDYFRRNFWLGCRGDERTLPSVVELVGDDRLLFTTDYPHSDATWPGGLEDFEAQPIPASSRARILWDNAAEALGL